ncbi:hypothetical protein F5146DRAFT_1176459 [Armillaria mellea]|nr:hypothetical protein F5146DRAFT_1176459 [Armillaria mellea]
MDSPSVPNKNWQRITKTYTFRKSTRPLPSPSNQGTATPVPSRSYAPSPGTLRHRQSTPYPQTTDSSPSNRKRKPVISLPVQSSSKRSFDQLSTPEPRVVRRKVASSISGPQRLGESVDGDLSELTPVESDQESMTQNGIVAGSDKRKARNTVQPSRAKASREKLQTEIQDLVAQLDRARGEINSLQIHRDQLLSEVHAYRDAAAVRELSPEQNRPQTLFSRADSYSCVDIISLVDALNGEIMQLSALISDELKFSRPPKQHLLDGMKAAVDRANEQLGIHFVLLLRGTRNRDAHRGLVRIALQAVLAQTCATTIQRWSVVNERTNAFLARLYKGFEEMKAPCVMAGQWKGMVRRWIKYDSEPEVLSAYTQILIDMLHAILCTSGWTNDGTREGIYRRFGNRIKEIARQIIVVDKAIGDVTSQDVQVFTVARDRLFNPSVMKDINHTSRDNDAQGTQSSVACTSDMGLMSRRKINGPAVTANVSGGQECWEEHILLRPGVVLYSDL